MKENTPAGGRKKSLDCSVKDGTAFSVMTGFGEQYFTPLAVELGASNMEIGILSSLPPFIASLPQLFTSRATAFSGAGKSHIDRCHASGLHMDTPCQQRLCSGQQTV